MKFYSMLTACALVLSLLCGYTSTGMAETTTAESIQTLEDMFTNRDMQTDYDPDGSVRITLDGDTASASSESVLIAGTRVTITQEATYVLSGTLEGGMIVVNASDKDKIHIILDGVHITNETSAALYILKADKVVVTLAEGTENTLASGEAWVAVDESNIDAAVFSRQDLTLNGTGALTVTSPAGHGIVSKDDLVITGGDYTVEAASHGLDANDSIRITGDTTMQISAGKDGIHAENNDDATRGFVYIAGGLLDIDAQGDGISAGAYMSILDGTISVLAGGGSQNAQVRSSGGWGRFGGGGRSGGHAPSADETQEESTSMKGLKAAGDLFITGGSFTIDSADDAVHANTQITVDGGTFDIASGDDAFHADETLRVNAGTIRIEKSYEGLEALDIVIAGGDITLVADDDGLNAAGGTDMSGMTGGRDAMFRRGGMSASNGSIVIAGGTLSIHASGDGIDANGVLTISGGYTVVTGPVQGDTATLDYDTSGVITGGTFIGTGSANMAQSFSDAEQGVVAVRMGSQDEGTSITLTDGSGRVLISHTPALPFGIVILSSPEIVSGETYTVTVGTSAGEVQAG